MPESFAAHPRCFVAIVDLQLADKLRTDMEEQGFTFSQPPHTLFSGKKKGISCTLYTSGKLMVQGKEMAEFIEFYLEPHILQSVAFTYRDTSVDSTERIGVDESGKGDFFGPLCIAGVYAAGDGVANLVKMGVKDSKKLNDAAVLKLAKEITRNYVHSIVRISPKRYNELYQQFRNLNSLLAWGHATVIENLATKTKSPKAVVDQFAAKYVVESALKRKHIEIELCQQHRAESDPVVAAASILARAAFLEGLAALGSQYGVSLPKGASKETVEAAKAIYASQGVSVFDDICKLHFKTFQTIVGADSGNNLRRSWGSLQDDQETP